MTNMEHPDRPTPVGSTATDVATPPTGTAAGGSPAGEDTGMKEQARQALGTAADEGKHVTATAGEEAQKLASQAKQQGTILLEEARSQLDEQSRTQRDRLAQALSSLGEDLERMSGQADSGLAADLVRNAAERARGFSSRLQGREPAEMLDDVRDFARRKPGTFLLGALAAGVVAGRLARGAQSASAGGSSSRSSGVVPAMRAPSDSTDTITETPTGVAVGGTTGSAEVGRTTPSSSSMAGFPADRPGEIR